MSDPTNVPQSSPQPNLVQDAPLLTNGIFPLNPETDGKVEFLGQEKVKYYSPPRQNHQETRSFVPPPPPYGNFQPNFQSVPLNVGQMPNYQQFQPSQMLMTQQAMPQMMYCPQMPMPMQMMMPQQQSPPQPPPGQNVNVVVNSSPTMTAEGGGGGGGGGGAGAGAGGPASGGVLICPKCRKGILIRKQDKFRKILILIFGSICCPCTCGLLFLCLRSNYVDTCGCCKKKYGHRGKKTKKNKVHAVKI